MPLQSILLTTATGISTTGPLVSHMAASVYKSSITLHRILGKTLKNPEALPLQLILPALYFKLQAQWATGSSLQTPSHSTLLVTSPTKPLQPLGLGFLSRTLFLTFLGTSFELPFFCYYNHCTVWKLSAPVYICHTKTLHALKARTASSLYPQHHAQVDSPYLWNTRDWKASVGFEY